MTLFGRLIQYLPLMGAMTIVLGAAASIMFGYPRRLWKGTATSARPTPATTPPLPLPARRDITPSIPSEREWSDSLR